MGSSPQVAMTMEERGKGVHQHGYRLPQGKTTTTTTKTPPHAPAKTLGTALPLKPGTQGPHNLKPCGASVERTRTCTRSAHTTSKTAAAAAQRPTTKNGCNPQQPLPTTTHTWAETQVPHSALGAITLRLFTERSFHAYNKHDMRQGVDRAGQGRGERRKSMFAANKVAP